MKTIFRFVNTGLFLAAVIALGTVAGFAQDPCADAAGQTALSDQIRAIFAKKDLDSLKTRIELSKQFQDKFGACDSAKEFTDYLKTNVPKWEASYATLKEKAAKDALVARFDTALKANNWDDVYSAGKEILSKYPDEFRTAEIVLGSIGGEEALKANFKYNDDALRFSKQSIADLEAGKPFVLGNVTRFGLSLKDSTGKYVYNFEFSNKDDAIGWLNMYIGYIIQVGQKNKANAAPYLFKATQAASESAKNPIPYELIGYYYFDQLDKLTEGIKVKAADQKDTDTPEVAKTKVDAIKADVALANGTAERAMDVFSRAYTLAANTPAAKPYKDKMYKNIEGAYKLRFGKTDGLSATWIDNEVKKPMLNPSTPVTPVSDPEPVTTTTSTTPPVATPTPTPVKPPVGTPVKPAPIKPAVTTPAKPAPAAAAKKQAAVKKTTKKKGV